MQDDYMNKHIDQSRSKANSGFLPTPHGRALAPWREVVECNKDDERLPAQDKLIYLY